MADVKFSELTSLAASDVASDDILAIVDTGASTSKKLSIDNLFGSVPVNIAQTDATDATSSAGAVRTAGGVSMAKKLYVGTTSTLVGAVTATAGVFPAAQDGAALGSGTLQFSDLFLADGGTITLGDDSDVTLTHVADTGVLLNAGMAMRFRDAAIEIKSSTDGQLDVDADGELEITSPIVDIDASTGIALDGANLNSAWTVNTNNKIQWRDTGLYINSSTDGQLDVDADGELEITAPIVDIDASTGIALDGANLNSTWTVNTDNKIQWRDTGLYINSSTNGQLDIDADAELEITAPIVDIDASTGIALDGANLNSAWLVNTTNQIRFHDTGQHISAPADGRLAITSDGDIELTAADVKIGTAGAAGNLQSLTDAYDTVLKQYDGHEVARIHDGATNLETGTLDLTAAAAGKGGFGFKKPVYNLTAGTDDQACALTAAHSGSIIMVTGSAYDLDITLPAIAAGEEGWHVEVAITTAFSGTNNLEIKTNGDSGDTIFMYMNTAGTSGVDVDAHDVIRTTNDAPAGTLIRLVCVKGGAAEQWIAEVLQPSGSAATTEAAIG
mgnify:CR=1 FL=1